MTPHAERGATLSQADCLIAAAALGADATLRPGTRRTSPSGDCGSNTGPPAPEDHTPTGSHCVSYVAAVDRYIRCAIGSANSQAFRPARTRMRDA